MVIRKFLLKWMNDYLLNRDLLFRKIQEIATRDDTHSEVKYKDGRIATLYAIPDLDKEKDMVFSMAKENEIILSTLNTKENLQTLIKNWPTFSLFKKLSVYFINPFSKTEKKWIIHPYTHDRICDRAALKLGLESMFLAVEPASAAEIENILKEGRDE